jgi:hypothetical protein
MRSIDHTHSDRNPMRCCLSLLVILMTSVSLSVASASAASITIKQLQALAREALRDGDVAYAPPSSKVVRGILWVKDVGPLAGRSGPTLDFWVDGGDQLKAVFLDQLAIEIRRQRLFAGTRRQLIIEPFYRRMEETVAAELLLIQAAGDDDEKQRQLDERLRQLGDLLQSGIEACARDMRLAGSFVEPGQDDGSVWLDRLFALYLPRQGQLSYPQIQQGVDQAIREKAITFGMPRIAVTAGTLSVTDVALPVDSVRHADGIEEVVAELTKLALRRRYAIQQPPIRAIMESVYAQMERSIRQRLDELRSSGRASNDSRRSPLSAASTPAADDDSGKASGEHGVARSAFGRSLGNLLQQGLERCAKNMGNLRLVVSAGASVPEGGTGKVRLAAPTGTTVEFVHNTDRKLWLLTGKTENDYRWVKYATGDSVDLAGGYWFRLTYADGRRASLYKNVGANDTELRLPGR